MRVISFTALAAMLLAGSTSGSSLTCPTTTAPTVSIDAATKSAVLANGYVCVVIDSGRIVSASADFDGNAQYGKNVFANGGLSLQLVESDGSVVQAVANAIHLAENTQGEVVSVTVDLADAQSTVQESWTVSLSKGQRFYTHLFDGKVVKDASLQAIRRQWEMSPASIYAWFKTGVVQMKAANSGQGFYPSNDPIQRVYGLGGPDYDVAGDASFDIIPDYGSTDLQTVLMNTNSGSPFWSGFQEILAGGIGDDKSILDHWGNPWGSVATSQVSANLTWRHKLEVGVNNLDFPVAKLSFGDNLARDDLHAVMTGIYASPVGCLCTHVNEVEDGQQVAQIATTPARPDRGYQGTYNFFDPDNYFSITAMLWSNEPYLQQQARMVLERSGQFLKPTGQLPHHFDGVTPVYQALSGEIQTGPNVFWILSCFNYAKATQDYAWLKNYMPNLRLASNFLFASIDPVIGLANVPGSLMIDVFLRWNFTSDTNAMLVGFFREFADAEEIVGNATGAATLRNLATSVSENMNKYLWSEEDDHFVTQWNGPVMNTTRDFVDYDANLIAAAFGIPDVARTQRLLSRIDNGKCRASSTWVSEVYYDASNCQGGNTGDSASAMARIAWFDALSRKRLGLVDEFNSLIMNPLQKILLGATWMHERLNCDGTQNEGRTAMYFEYPSATSMLIREVRYGINIGLGQLTVAPFGVSDFSYSVGNVAIQYSSKLATIGVPNLHPQTRFSLHSLAPSSAFDVMTSCQGHLFGQTTVTSDASGLLEFSINSQGCDVVVKYVASVLFA
eukprot:TRINITY_DN527_c0_g1_i1.p1 TRINITY_DN527_c0_g1~~TRINITY_DN527_c0_g1_i1.p1  ORF type:complete len:787 (+),score=222.04 TRINITY_DN527_c0_g1_i1:101-2461(+)